MKTDYDNFNLKQAAKIKDLESRLELIQAEKDDIFQKLNTLQTQYYASQIDKNEQLHMKNENIALLQNLQKEKDDIIRNFQKQNNLNQSEIDELGEELKKSTSLINDKNNRIQKLESFISLLRDNREVSSEQTDNENDMTDPKSSNNNNNIMFTITNEDKPKETEEQTEIYNIKQFLFYYMNLSIKLDSTNQGKTCNFDSNQLYSEFIENDTHFTKWPERIIQEIDSINQIKRGLRKSPSSMRDVRKKKKRTTSNVTPNVFLFR